MTVTAPRSRPSVAARRVGYVVSVLVNIALLYLVNGWPGWEAVPFLTLDTQQVIGLVNTSIVASLLTNVVYLFYDAPWLRSFGDLATTAIGLAALISIWNVFPFDFEASSFDWAVLVRIGLVVGILGSAIGIVVQLVSLMGRPSRHLPTSQ